MAGGSFHKGVFGMKQQRVACRLPGCKEEKLQFCGGRTPVCTSCHLSALGKSSIAHQVVLFLY